MLNDLQRNRFPPIEDQNMQPYLGTKQKTPYKEQLEKYLSSTQAKERRKFNEFVQSIDAFGPEICLNLKMVNIYRYR